jgi:hypothetical protein
MVVARMIVSRSHRVALIANTGVVEIAKSEKQTERALSVSNSKKWVPGRYFTGFLLSCCEIAAMTVT